MDYFPWFAHAVSINSSRTAMRAFLSSFNRCLHYHLLLSSPDLPHSVIFKSKQDCGTIFLALGHGGKTSFRSTFCSRVLTTIDFVDNFFPHSVKYSRYY